MNLNTLLTGFWLVITLELFQATEVLRPRGVPLSKKIFYDPSKDFSCIDGSTSIPFRYVNDDYCDCRDGSDEPGTSACSNGVFHCTNVGFFASNIPSSRVNDGVCDCCDTSDEYNSTANCVNNCKELGEMAKEAERRAHAVFYAGKDIRDQYVKDAKAEREECQIKLNEYRKEIVAVEAMKNEKEALKKAAENKEKIALAKYKQKLKDSKRSKDDQEIRDAEKEDQELAASAFLDLDANEDEVLHYTELKSHMKFDQDADGVVSDDEAKFFLHMKEEMDLSEFQSTGWHIMKPYYFKDKEPETLRPPRRVTPRRFDPDFPEAELPPDVTPPSSEDEEETGDMTPSSYTPKPYDDIVTATPDPSMPYDEETQEIVNVAKRAREEFEEVENKWHDLNTKIRELEVTLETDYGSEHEFMALRGRCFEFNERQYVYKFCPFDKASQRSSEDGASDVSLGKWGKWSGPEYNKYERMKFEGGAGCWNGPSRSVQVYLSCGDKNQMLAASEPSRCEYRFDFQTPAMCVRPTDSTASHEHTEL